MSVSGPNWFLHAANVLMLAAYSVRDVLWLRLLAVCASLVALPYFFLQPYALWTPIAWSGVFISINLLRSWTLYRERRPIQLTEEEEQVRQLALRDLPPRKVLQVLSLGSWITTETNERLLQHGKVPGSIALIVRGKVRAMRDNRFLGELREGDLVGSALILTGSKADVDAIAVEPVRAVRWRISTLMKYLAANPDVRSAVQRHLSRDLAAKVERLSAA